jgi:hypothetical protein
MASKTQLNGTLLFGFIFPTEMCALVFVKFI